MKDFFNMVLGAWILGLLILLAILPFIALGIFLIWLVGGAK